jgi:TM2 domain-containing membrane protein YozV
VYCRHCGHADLANEAVYCVSCGVQPLQGVNFCNNCGSRSDPYAVACVNCGIALGSYSRQPIAGYAVAGSKSKLSAGLFGIFLGVFGVHRFYLGYTTIGLTMVLVATIGGLFTCGIATIGVSIWGLIEGIMILTGSGGFTTDAAGIPLAD